MYYEDVEFIDRIGKWVSSSLAYTLLGEEPQGDDLVRLSRPELLPNALKGIEVIDGFAPLNSIALVCEQAGRRCCDYEYWLSGVWEHIYEVEKLCHPGDGERLKNYFEISQGLRDSLAAPVTDKP